MDPGTGKRSRREDSWGPACCTDDQAAGLKKITRKRESTLSGQANESPGWGRRMTGVTRTPLNCYSHCSAVIIAHGNLTL